MDFVTLTGLAAGSLTTIAFLPQFLRAWKTKSTRDISLETFMILCLGVLLWLVYGIMRQDVPVIAANAVTLIIACGILFLKNKYG